MFDSTQPFTIQYNDMTCPAQEYDLVGDTVFRITFPDNRQPLVIARTEGSKGKIWTSVPEGRQEEAAEVGEQVLKHLTRK